MQKSQEQFSLLHLVLFLLSWLLYVVSQICLTGTGLDVVTEEEVIVASVWEIVLYAESVLQHMQVNVLLLLKREMLLLYFSEFHGIFL